MIMIILKLRIGGELITKYEDYESTLKEAGHTCKLVSDK